MSKTTKRILIIGTILLVVGGVGAYLEKGKIMKLVKGDKHPRVAAQQATTIDPLPWDPSKSGNQAMTDYLHKVYDVVNKPGLRFMNTAITESLLAKPIPSDAGGMYQWYFDACNQLLNCGKVNESVAKAKEFESKPQFAELSQEQLGQWYYTKGLVYLRFGEVENCIGNHNAESCIWPLSKAAQSQKVDGPAMAVESYTNCLKYQPTNLSAMWLLGLRSNWRALCG